MSSSGRLRWHRVLVRGDTPAVGGFYQVLWVARCTESDVAAAVAAHLCAAGDTVVEVERCEAVEEPAPAFPDVSAAGRAYFRE